MPSPFAVYSYEADNGSICRVKEIETTTRQLCLQTVRSEWHLKRCGIKCDIIYSPQSYQRVCVHESVPRICKLRYSLTPVPKTQAPNTRAETHVSITRTEGSCEIHVPIVPNSWSRDDKRPQWCRNMPSRRIETHCSSFSYVQCFCFAWYIS